MATLKVTNIKNESFAGDQLYLKTDGKIGIGTTSPTELLNVEGTIECLNELRSKTGNDLKLNAGSANRDVFLQVNDSTLMTVQGSTGKVGIGTTSPQQLLHVWPDAANTTSAYVRVTAGDRNSNTGVQLGHNSSGNGELNVVSNGHLTLFTNNSERITITNTGFVGIGTTSPNSKFQVNDTNPVIAEFYHSDGGTNDEARIALGAYSSNPPAQRGITLVGKNNGAGHDFIVNTSSSAGLGPTEKLKVGSDGTVTVQSEDVVFGTTNKGIEFPNSVSIKQNLSNLYVNLASGNNNVEVQSNGTSFVKLRGTNGDVELVNGNLAISTSGKGIDFSASGGPQGSGSEILDDYEEGTFTPTVTGSSSTGTVSYTNQYGFYTKVGNMVNLWIMLNYSESGSSGNLQIGSLPFGNSGTTGSYAVGAFQCNDMEDSYQSNVGQYTPYLAPSGTVITLRGTKTNGSGYESMAIQGMSYMRIQHTYRAA